VRVVYVACALRASCHRYRLSVRGANGEMEQYVCEGTDTAFMLDEFQGRGLRTGDKFNISVEYRDKDDASAEDGGWKGNSGPVPMSTLCDNVPDGWKVPLQLSNKGSRHVSVQWQQPPGTKSDDIEYVCVTVNVNVCM